MAAAARVFLAALGLLLRIVMVAWATLAIYYSPLPGLWLRVALATAFLAFSAWALWLTRRPHMTWAFAAVFLVVLAGWSFIEPSHDRPWRPEVAVMPRAIIDADRVRRRLARPDIFEQPATNFHQRVVGVVKPTLHTNKLQHFVGAIFDLKFDLFVEDASAGRVTKGLQLEFNFWVDVVGKRRRHKRGAEN